jgi:hypothetical protein
MMRRGLIVTALLASGAAVAAEPIEISPGTYLLSEISRAGIFASLPKLKMKVLREANAFAALKGLVAVPVSMNATPAGGPGQWPEVEYQFRLVPAGDPDASKAVLVPRADVVIESHQTTSAEPQEKQPDLYTELTKLDDLRKRGLLTDAEFDAQKKKLLEKQR